MITLSFCLELGIMMEKRNTASCTFKIQDHTLERDAHTAPEVEVNQI